MIVLLRFLFFAGFMVLWIYAVVDVIRTDPERVPYLNKLIWLLVVLLFAPIGPIAWLVLRTPANPHPASGRSASIPPDDSPEYLKRLDEELRRRRRAEEIRGGGLEPDNVDDEIGRLEEQFRDDPDEPKT